MQIDESAYVYRLYKSHSIKGNKFLRVYDRYELSSWLRRGKKLIPWERKSLTLEGMNISMQNNCEYKDILNRIKILEEGKNPIGTEITDEQIAIRLEYLKAVKLVYEEALGPSITSEKPYYDCTATYTDFFRAMREIFDNNHYCRFYELYMG